MGRDKVTRESKGYAFIEFESVSDSQDALKGMDGKVAFTLKLAIMFQFGVRQKILSIIGSNYKFGIFRHPVRRTRCLIVSAEVFFF